MATNLKTLKITVVVDSKGVVRGFKGAKGEVLSFGQEADKTGAKTRGLSRTFGGLGVGMLGAGAAIAVVTRAMGAALGQTIRLEKGVREIGTLMGGLTTKQVDVLSDRLKNLSVQTGQTLDKLTKANYDIVSAGFSDMAESAEVLAASADLATGGVTDITVAADLLTTTLNSYSLAASDATEVNDQLFTIVRLGKTTMDELGGSMGRVLAIAGQADVGLNEVGAALAALTAQGQSTEEATTAIRASIVELLKPQDSLKKLIKETGFESGQALIKSEGYAGAIQAIADKARETGVPMTDLFQNVRSMQAVLPLTGTAAKIFARNLDDMENSAGAAALAVAEMEK